LKKSDVGGGGIGQKKPITAINGTAGSEFGGAKRGSCSPGKEEPDVRRGTLTKLGGGIKGPAVLGGSRAPSSKKKAGVKGLVKGFKKVRGTKQKKNKYGTTSKKGSDKKLDGEEGCNRRTREKSRQTRDRGADGESQKKTCPV